MGTIEIDKYKELSYSMHLKKKYKETVLPLPMSYSL